MAKSIEEQVEDWAKKSLDDCGVKHFAKNAVVNSEIGSALKDAPSKKGGKGSNFPDIQVLIEPKKSRYIPVMIEAKGKKGDLVKVDADGKVVVENVKPDGKPDYKTISKYALNGAVHYAEAIVNRPKSSYPEAIAIGVNGWTDASGKLQTEMAVYYVSKDNFCIPKEIAVYSDFSFLAKKNLPEFLDKIESIDLSEADKEKKTREIENQIEIELKNLNQSMQDELAISENMRVTMVSGMIMAGLGVDGKVAALEVAELKGQLGKSSHDGAIILSRIDDFLASKDLPEEKHKVIMDVLSSVFTGNHSLYAPKNGESPLKTVYKVVHDKIMPYFTSKHHLDFTGRLFNVLNAWVKNPDGAANDVVLTPRYVTDFMARLACVNKDSYVWDYALGSAGFLISSMKLMIADAKEKCKSPAEFNKKVLQIKHEQLLGIEKLPEVYMLAVLNMILMQDGSANIIHANSLTQFDGNYQQGDHKDKPFPANVFLLNPPYSADGKGFVFVEKALSRMTHGRAAVLIQENAGSGNGHPYTENILKHSTLLASIRMPEKLFTGKATVQTAIYVFEVGKPHNAKQVVKFIDLDDDGYDRRNRKKSSLSANLRDVGNAKARYEEIVNLVLYGKKYLKLFPVENYIEDTISQSGEDWTIKQHRKIDTTARIEDFEKVVRDYLEWRVKTSLKRSPHSSETVDFACDTLSLIERKALKDWKNGTVRIGSKAAKELFLLKKGKRLTKNDMLAGDINFIGATAMNNGITAHISNNAHILPPNTITVSYNGSVGEAFYQEKPYWASDDINAFIPQFKMTRETALYFCAVIRKLGRKYAYDFKWQKEIMQEELLTFPATQDGLPDVDYIDTFIRAIMKLAVLSVIEQRNREVAAMNAIIGIKSNKPRWSVVHDFPDEGDYEDRMAAFEDTEK